MQESIKTLIKLGYSEKDANDLATKYPLCNLKDETLKNNIISVYNYLLSLGHTKTDIIKMTKLLPALYGYSKKNIQDKIDFLISIGYTKKDVIKMTKLLPTLYSYSKENIRDKIEYLKSVKLEFIVLCNPKYLIQSTKLTYARYKFLTEEKNICISKENYRKLYINNKQFESSYGISKQELLERYPYEKVKTLYKIKKL